MEPDPEPTVQHAANTELLSYLQESLNSKEKELECPVCLESAEVPIFMCHESHLVCHNCLPKLKTCPECREKMPNPPKRHRYAEKQLEEAKKIELEIDIILNNCTEKHNQPQSLTLFDNELLKGYEEIHSITATTGSPNEAHLIKPAGARIM